MKVSKSTILTTCICVAALVVTPMALHVGPQCRIRTSAAAVSWETKENSQLYLIVSLALRNCGNTRIVYCDGELNRPQRVFFRDDSNNEVSRLLALVHYSNAAVLAKDVKELAPGEFVLLSISLPARCEQTESGIAVVLRHGGWETTIFSGRSYSCRYKCSTSLKYAPAVILDDEKVVSVSHFLNDNKRLMPDGLMEPVLFETPNREYLEHVLERTQGGLGSGSDEVPELGELSLR